MAAQNRTRSRKWQGAFLKALAKEANVTEACRKAKIGRRTAYDLREADPAFSAAWDEAIEEAVDNLELVAVRRAKKKSDKLLIVLLKAYRPRYRDSFKHEMSGEVVNRHAGKVGHEHDINERLLPYAGPVRQFLQSVLDDGSRNGAVHSNGTGQPLDTP